MASPSAFRPKQAVPMLPQYMKLVIGTASDDVASSVLHSHLLPLPASAHLHDNGCGTGVVSLLALASQPTLRVTATDFNAKMVDAAKAALSAAGFGAPQVNVFAADATDLAPLADGVFSHSFANFVLHTGLDSKRAAEETYRTLREGGKAYVSCWSDIVHDAALLEAHDRTRPEGTKHPLREKRRWKEGEYLAERVREGGFEDVEVVQADGFVEIKDLREWAMVAWSLLGAAVGGWTEQDEERWDEAVEIIYKKLDGSDRLEKREDGSYRYRMGANVVIATK